MTQKMIDNRSHLRDLRRILPAGLFRFLTVVYNAVFRCIPYSIKYPLAGWLRKGKMPYGVIEDGDIVVQVGAPKDLLGAGRSRAMHFARFVGCGKVVVVEPGAENADGVRHYAQSHGLSECVIVVERGAWSTKKDIVFLYSPKHPAASVLEGVREIPEEQYRRLAYQRVVVPVDSIDHILAEVSLPCPKLVSITTNGAELEIVNGMKETMASGCPYVSLASTGEGYVEHLAALGYKLIARDDRGYLFAREAEGDSHSGLQQTDRG